MKSMPYVLRWISLTAITLVMVLCINRSNYDPKTYPEGQISESPNMPDEGDLITSFSIIAYTKPNVKTTIYHLWPDIYDRRDAQFVLSKGESFGSIESLIKHCATLPTGAEIHADDPSDLKSKDITFRTITKDEKTKVLEGTTKNKVKIYSR